MIQEAKKGPRRIEDVPEKDRIRSTDTTIETLVGFGGEMYEETVKLPRIMIAPDPKGKVDDNSESGGNDYRTEIISGAGDVNLNWHPTIVCGRCELCGSTRYVGGEVWKIVNKKNGDVSYRYRGGQWVEVDAAHCPHYRQVKPIACSYCRNEFTGMKDQLGQFTELMGERNIYVCSRPETPNRLVMHCSDFSCKHKFNLQFHINPTI